jgi:NitT/TauT family transport system ATP-binding protein
LICVPEGDCLLEVSGVTLQYKTARHLVTAAYSVDFNVHEGDRYAR